VASELRVPTHLGSDVTSGTMSKPKSMHKIREILRLRLDQKQELRAVALSVGASPSTVHGHVARAQHAYFTHRGHPNRGIADSVPAYGTERSDVGV